MASLAEIRARLAAAESNKGGLVVLSKSEAADPATGKRRG